MSTVALPPQLLEPRRPTPSACEADGSGNLHRRRTGIETRLPATPPFVGPPLPARRAHHRGSAPQQSRPDVVTIGQEHGPTSDPVPSGPAYYPEEQLRAMGKIIQDETLAHNRTKVALANEINLRMTAVSRGWSEMHRTAEINQALQLCREHANQFRDHNRQLSLEVQELRARLHQLTMENERMKLQLDHPSTIQHQIQMLHRKIESQANEVEVDAPPSDDVEQPGKRRRMVNGGWDHRAEREISIVSV